MAHQEMCIRDRAYTLQILAQKGSNPTVISLLLSLESVFATISSAIILGDRLNGM